MITSDDVSREERPVASPSTARAATMATTTRALLTPRAAATVATFALGLGLAGNRLLSSEPTGLGVAAWVVLFAYALVATVHRQDRTVPREAWLWLGTSIAFAALVAWRASEELQFFNLVASAGAMLMAAVCVRDASAGILAARFRDTFVALVLSARGTLIGALPLFFRELAGSAGKSATNTWRRALRTLAISGAILLVFGSLLRSADPIFSSMFSLRGFDVDGLIRNGVAVVLLSMLFAGLARSALLPPVADVPWWSAKRTLAASDVTTALVTLNLLFAAFIAAQLGWFFGGEAFLHARTGLTAAEYARKGFFQMIFTVTLLVPLLLAARWSLPDTRAATRRFALLALPLLVLLGAMILSAALRMRLYVQYYGLSTDRLNPLFFMAWLAFVLVWFALTVLRGRDRGFIAGALVTCLATLVVVDAAAPDAIVARVNMARANAANATGPAGATRAVAGENSRRPVDVVYLARLSGEAVPLAIEAIVHPSTPAPTDADRCKAAARLLDRWGSASATYARTKGWRTWNAGDALAVHAVAANASALESLRATCNSRT